MDAMDRAPPVTTIQKVASQVPAYGRKELFVALNSEASLNSFPHPTHARWRALRLSALRVLT